MDRIHKILPAILALAVYACTGVAPPRASGPAIAVRIAAEQTAAGTAQPRADLAATPRMLVPVSVNEQGPFQFLFDTGATHVVLSAQLVEQLRLSANQQLRMRIRGVSGVSTVPTVDVLSVNTGELQLGRLRAPMLTGPVMERIDGILGMQRLGDKKVIADLLRHEVRIIDSAGVPAAPQYSVVPFETITHRFIAVDVLVAGVRARAVIDTGGTQTLGNYALLNALIKRSEAKSLTGFRSSVVDTTTVPIPTVLLTVPNLQLGNVEFLQLPVSFGGFSVFEHWGLQNKPALLVAMDALGALQEISIDYRRQELQLLGRAGQ